MATQDILPSLDGSLRRSRSAGDIPSRPEAAHLRSSLRISQIGDSQQAPRNHEAHSNAASATSQHQSPSNAPSTSAANPSWAPTSSATHPSSPLQPLQGNAPLNDQHPGRSEPILRNVPLYARVMMYFGIGRNASYARKSLVSLIWNVSWGFLQLAIIITMLILTGTRFKSHTDPNISEWTACDRPLGIWASLWVVRVILATSLAYWDYLRERVLHPSHTDTEAANIVNNLQRLTAPPHSPNASANIGGTRSTNDASTSTRPTEVPHLAYSRTYSRLTLISSLTTLSWFLTAHILEYTSVSTCRHTSPHLWWLIFGILCIMYLMVLEVVLLGLIVLVVAPLIFIFWNIFLICIGRHPMQNPHMIKPEIGKLSKSVVERIPLVMYIPPPPESEGLLSAPVSHIYPPKVGYTTSKPSQRRFVLLRPFPSFRSKRSRDIGEADHTDEKAGDALSDTRDPISWEENWEQSEYPFVALEGNRAACAICLMDFEEPKRKNATNVKEGEQDPASEGQRLGAGIESSAIAEERRADGLKLEDAGLGAQPLRLLQCGHVFHKTCLDPWLIDVSGRCPVCQRPVELPKPDKKTRQPP